MGAPRLLLRFCQGSARGAWRTVFGLGMVLALSGGVQAQIISGARFAEPTSEYPHAVLGDALEWKSVEIDVTPKDGTAAQSRKFDMRSSDNLVYEDVMPRLWDITGDGSPEVVVVQSHQQRGARLLVIGLNRVGEPEVIARTGHIGTRFRWLAPVGAADFDGDGAIEIAFVDRPHLAKTLRVWRYTEDMFEEIATLRGVTNHKIGEDFISGGVRDCGAGPEMILADANWHNLVAVRLTNTEVAGTRIGAFSGPVSFDAALACQ